MLHRRVPEYMRICKSGFTKMKEKRVDEEKLEDDKYVLKYLLHCSTVKWYQFFVY